MKDQPCFYHFALAAVLLLARATFGQVNPSPQPLPVHQDWGTMGFTSLPMGFAAWNGLSGVDINTQAGAEASTPSGDAPIIDAAPTNGGTGGCYGYAPAGDARFAVLTSSNGINGINQLAAAVNTSGGLNLVLEYDMLKVIDNPRTVGVVCQYRRGGSGPWTTLVGNGNPYVQNSLQAGVAQHVRLRLPHDVEDQPLVQFRWAVWRGTEGGNSSGFAIDNIRLSGLSFVQPHCTPQLLARDINAAGTIAAVAGPYGLVASVGQSGGIEEAGGSTYALRAGFWPIDDIVSGDALSADIDGDSDADFDDMALFVSVLLGIEQTPVYVNASDLNCDGNPDALDIRIFIDVIVP